MTTPKITHCGDCTDIEEAIDIINCRIFQESIRQYNNIIFSLGLKINTEIIKDLLHYKRILEFKSVNEEYASHYSVPTIINRVKFLIHK